MEDETTHNPLRNLIIYTGVKIAFYLGISYAFKKAYEEHLKNIQ